MKIKLEVNERLDNLGDNYFIIQNTDYFLFGIDAVLLADFAGKYIKKKSKIAEIGTGSGIIPLLINKRVCFDCYDGFELQPEMAKLAQRNIKLNGIQKKIKIECKDVRNYRDFPQNYYNIVIVNPPYFPYNSSENSKRTVISPNESKRIARNEVTLNLDSLLKFSSWVLRERGRLIIIYRPERLAELFNKALKSSLEPKVLRFIYSDINKEAILVLIELSKRGKSGIKIERPLIIYENNQYSEEINRIYNGISRIKELKSEE